MATEPSDTPPNSAPQWTDRPLEIFRPRRWLRRLQWGAMTLGLLGSLATLAVGIWRWTLAYTQYGPAVVWRWSLPWLLAAVGLSPAVLLGFASYWRTRRTGVALYPSGLIYQHRGRRVQIPWQEIQRITLSGPWSDLPVLRAQGDPAGMTLHTTELGHVRITQDLERFEDLVTKVKENVYPRMHKAYAQAFNRGKTLHFGPLSLSQSGVHVGRRRVPWSQIVAAELHRGSLKLRLVGAGDDLEIASTRVPNVDLCVQLIQSLAEER